MSSVGIRELPPRAFKQEHVMNESDKFESFRARTPTEMMLHNEIRRLRRENYILRCEKGIQPSERFNRSDITVAADFPPEIRMVMGARILGQIDEQGRLSVDARCYSSGQKLGFAYYLSPQEAADIYHLTDMLMHKHEMFVHAVADELISQPVLAGT